MIPFQSRWQRIAAIERVAGISQEQQTVIMLGGPYPETRNSWLELVADLDPLAGRWLAWAFEAYRITPRVHAQILNCQHPDARLFDQVPHRVTCLSCRILNDLEVVAPLPSLDAMGDVTLNLEWLRLEVAQ